MERGGQEKLLVLVPAQEQALQSHELQILELGQTSGLAEV